MNILVISDVHLSTYGCHAKRATALFKICKTLKRSTQQRLT
jgi:hypothetical protein